MYNLYLLIQELDEKRQSLDTAIHQLHDEIDQVSQYTHMYLYGHTCNK